MRVGEGKGALFKESIQAGSRHGASVTQFIDQYPTACLLTQNSTALPF